MSGFSDLVPNPWNIIKKTAEAPFQKRTDQPWLQGTARNLGHAAFGDKIGNEVDTEMLGDYPGGFRNAPTQMGAPLVSPTMEKPPALKFTPEMLLAWLKNQSNSNELT